MSTKRILRCCPLLLALSAPLSGDDFYTVTPCRILDTRSTQALPTNSAFTYAVGGLCGIPEDATSVSLNVTLLPQAGASVDLGLFPGDLAGRPPSTSVVSGAARPAVASNAIIALSDDGYGMLAALARSTSIGQVDFVLDANGYFKADPIPSAWPGPGDEEAASATDLASESYADTLGAEPPPMATVAGQGGANNHYFLSASNQPVPLVGVSADNACHYNKTGYGQCNYGNYQQVLDDVAHAGLNVIRLWVNVGGLGMKPSCRNCPPTCKVDPALDPTDEPFGYDGSSPLADGLGRWRLDVRNAPYFSRLHDVVQYAANMNPPIYVEITLFSPQTENLQLSPWSSTHAYLNNGTHLGGFTDAAQFVDADSAQYQSMKPYIFKVVDWTVDALYQFSNVYYEIANEPEWISNFAPSKCAGWAGRSTTVPLTVAKWHKDIATELKRYLALKGSVQQIGIGPMTTLDADEFRSSATPPGQYSASVSILNSHYTYLNPDSGTGTNVGNGLGAIKLVRSYYTEPKILGFNETKIIAGGCSLSSGTKQSVNEGRAEAWEFMVDQGGIYNQFGYGCPIPVCPNPPRISTNNYCETRRELGALRRFVAGAVNIGRNMKTSPSSGNSWINIGPYPSAPFLPNTVYKFWAAVEPTSTASTRRWLLYIHHSVDRQKDFDGYHQPITNPPTSWQESRSTSPLSVCLGSTGSAHTYTAMWLDPANPFDATGQLHPLQSQTIPWTPVACTPGGPNAVTLAPSPNYAYDIALFIS